MAFHSLARRRRWYPTLAGQVGRLCDYSGYGELLESAFQDAGCPALMEEFDVLLQSVRGGDPSGGPRLIEIAAKIARHAPSARGAPLSYDSALHQALLRWNRQMGGRQGYTYDDLTKNFIDEATTATRIERGRPSFNPTSARLAVTPSVSPWRWLPVGLDPPRSVSCWAS